MITVMILNFNNLNPNKNQSEKKAEAQQVVIMEKTNQEEVKNQPTREPTSTLDPTVDPTQIICKKEIGPVDILSPQEGEIISKDSVCINIATKNDYCPVTWSYEINDGSWSDFTDKNICLYNLTNGDKRLQIKIKSTVSDESITLKRDFTYQGAKTTPAPTATTSSAGL